MLWKIPSTTFSEENSLKNVYAVPKFFLFPGREELFVHYITF